MTTPVRSAAHPHRYASAKLPQLLRWWSGDLGASLQRLGPLLCPRVPPPAWMGMAANSAPTEDTAARALAALQAGRSPGSPGFPRHARFHELGWAGTSGGRWDRPAPNTDTSTENNWFRLHNDPRVRGVLRRDASMTDWHNLDDQTAIGIVSLLDHAKGVARGLPEGVKATEAASLWFLACAFGGWSAGSPRFRRHLLAHAPALSSMPLAARWGAAVRALSTGPRGAATHANPAYSGLRTAQKLESARKLAETTPWGGLWLDPQLPDAAEVYDRLVWAAGIGSRPVAVQAPVPTRAVTPAPRPPSQASRVPTGVVVAGAAVVAAAGAYLLWPPDAAPTPAVG